MRALLRETVSAGLGLGLSGGAAGGGTQLGGVVLVAGVGLPGPAGFPALAERLARVVYDSVRAGRDPLAARDRAAECGGRIRPGLAAARGPRPGPRRITAARGPRAIR